MSRGKPRTTPVAAKLLEKRSIRLWVGFPNLARIARLQVFCRHIDPGLLEVATDPTRVAHRESPDGKPGISELLHALLRTRSHLHILIALFHNSGQIFTGG